MQRTIRAPEATAGEPVTLRYLLVALLADGLINRQQADLRSEDNDAHPLMLIARQEWHRADQPGTLLTLEILTRWLARRTHIDYLRLDPLKIDVQKMTSYVSQAYASKLQILPVMVNDQELTVASAEPFVDHWISELETISRRQIRRVLINPKDLQRYLGEFYGISRSLLGASRGADSLSLLENFEQLLEVGKAGEPDADNRHLVSIVDWLLQFAFEQRASDIHLEPRREQGRVRLRIDGQLHKVHEFPSHVLAAVTSRLKSLARMDVTDRRRPQDGRIKTVTPSGKEVEMRLSSMPTTFGEVLVLRIFDPDILARDFSQLGFSKSDIRRYRSLLASPHGIILVTGPTGSGKTTTLYSSLYGLARPELNVCTIEDPIEMVEPQFNQMQVQTIIGVDFASGVRTLLRQDPDIIMVGEIRDRETAGVAIQAALTGHLVLSSLHTNDASSAITRLLDIGVEHYLLNATLLGVLAQRLVRTLCPHCRHRESVDVQAWQDLVRPHERACPESAFVSQGCDECRHTGYLGRSGVYEILALDQGMRGLIAARADQDTLRRHALDQGMHPLKLSAAAKVAGGQTSLT